MFRTLSQALADPGMQWLLLALALALLTWPLASLLAEGDFLSVLARFFGVFAAGVALVAAVSRALRRRDTPR